jgi:hypothetical protein
LASIIAFALDRQALRTTLVAQFREADAAISRKPMGEAGQFRDDTGDARHRVYLQHLPAATFQHIEIAIDKARRMRHRETRGDDPTRRYFHQDAVASHAVAPAAWRIRRPERGSELHLSVMKRHAVQMAAIVAGELGHERRLPDRREIEIAVRRRSARRAESAATNAPMFAHSTKALMSRFPTVSGQRPSPSLFQTDRLSTAYQSRGCCLGMNDRFAPPEAAVPNPTLCERRLCADCVEKLSC